jgi:hypothetical protein
MIHQAEKKIYVPLFEQRNEKIISIFHIKYKRKAFLAPLDIICGFMNNNPSSSTRRYATYILEFD